MGKKTKISALYTKHQQLLIQVDKSVYVNELVRIVSGLNVDLSGLDLSDMVAPRLQFYYRQAYDSFLMNGSYPRSKFGKSLFNNSECSESDFSHCDFRGSVFSGSIFRNANLSGADLKRAFFIGVDFSGANLRGADLRSCNIVGSNFIGADLRETNIEGVDFTDCELDFIKIDRDFKSTFNQLN